MKGTTCAAMVLIAMSLAGCQEFEGRYSPACTAFAGSTLELKRGRFVLDRFTDAVMVDENGEIIDQFPDFPRSGTFHFEENKAVFTAEDGSVVDPRYLITRDGRHYLLTLYEYDIWQQHGEIPECALVLGGVDGG